MKDRALGPDNGQGQRDSGGKPLGSERRTCKGQGALGSGRFSPVRRVPWASVGADSMTRANAYDAIRSPAPPEHGRARTHTIDLVRL